VSGKYRPSRIAAGEGRQMKNINKLLIEFLHAGSGEEDIEEIVHGLNTGWYNSLKLLKASRTKQYDSDFIFNNQNYKLVITSKLPVFYSSQFDESEEEDDLSDGSEGFDDEGVDN
jgi:hypothetical protein